MKYNKTNFFKHTYCQFQNREIEVLEEQNIHFKSKSGSSYIYTEEGVYRYSNHWGRVANCRWKLDGVSKYQNQQYYVGYANWSDFYSLTSNDKLFNLEVNFETQKVEVHKTSGKKTGTLFSITTVFKKKKEIESIFKNPKWMLYYEEEHETLQKKIIEKLINSDKTLQQIKLELVNN
ncbi:hypothetical protein [Tenacibaculum amylolyticum]|uniref:hypothetical protein n=1 Tax=Tenacibaculum amylolyticum TaxID=104269 RepID=UPI0038B6200E